MTVVARYGKGTLKKKMARDEEGREFYGSSFMFVM